MNYLELNELVSKSKKGDTMAIGKLLDVHQWSIFKVMTWVI
ncbi:MAG: hypothetical protein RR636_05705 [Clostridium sp.]